MNKNAKKHLTAIKAGKIDASNVRGIVKMLNIEARQSRGYSVAYEVSKEDCKTLIDAIHKEAPEVTGDYLESGKRLLLNKRNRKNLGQVIEKIESGILSIRLCDFWGEGLKHYGIFMVQTNKGAFRYFNIPWQSGGNGPEVF